jgi:hypothetical protein
MKTATHDAAHHDDHHGDDEHHGAPASQPVARDPDLPTLSDTSLGFFAAGALLVFVVALVTLIG